MGNDEPNAQNFLTHLRSLYGDRAEAILKLYQGTTPDQVKRSAQDLASDRFIAFGTWKWMEAHLKTGDAPVYRYRFEQILPSPVDAAPHASEIEFVFQVLSARKLPWRPADRTVSGLMGAYWSNFAKYGDPNGEDFPLWPVYRPKARFARRGLGVGVGDRGLVESGGHTERLWGLLKELSRLGEALGMDD